MLRNQAAIKQQLRLFLDTQNNTDTFLNYLTQLGFCYSFSLCRAAMRHIRMLRWWEAALNEIAAWNGTTDALQAIIALPDAEKPITLKILFDRIIHYIVFNQGSIKQYPHCDLNQYDFLKPHGQFQILQGKTVLHITNKYKIGGYFSSENMIRCLHDARYAIGNNLCLISNKTHCCELSYVDNQWHFYDPKYPDGKSKIFHHLENLIQEIVSKLGHTILIELACINNQTLTDTFSYYKNQLLMEDPETLLQGEGCDIIAMHPDLMFTVLENLERKNKLGCFDLNTPNSAGKVPLTFAARYNEITTIAALIKAGANPDQANTNGYTPLILAVLNDHIPAIKKLLIAGANPDLAHAKSDQWTPLIYAVLYSQAETVALLLNANAKPDKPSANGYTPLFYAVHMGRIEIINLLLKAGADSNQLHSSGSTPLILAAQNGDAETITILCNAGADPNKSSPSGATSLMVAAQNGHIDAIKALYNAGAILNQSHPSGGAPFMLAAQHGHTEIIKFLLPRQIDLSAVMTASVSVLLNAAGKHDRYSEVENYLKSNNSGIMPNTIPGYTALHLAVFFGHPKIVDIIIRQMNLTIETLKNLCELAEVMDHFYIYVSLDLKIKKMSQNKIIRLQSSSLTLFEKNMEQPTKENEDLSSMTAVIKA